MIKWIKDKWAKFEAWVAERVPGWKTHIVSALGVISSVALIAQEYIKGLPLEQFVTARTIVITNIVLFSLIFWLRNIGGRVEDRNV